MHHGDALAEGRLEHGFALRDLHLDADRLEPNSVGCRRHEYAFLEIGKAGGSRAAGGAGSLDRRYAQAVIV
jgi:hypothetical protein